MSNEASLNVGLLPQSQTTGPYQEAWTMLREAAQGMPQAVNWVTVPSRSADIERTLLLGAHGPKRLYIAILNDKKTH